MSDARPSVNILHRYGHALFGPHFDPVRDGFDVVENDTGDRAWDLVIVFEAIAAPQCVRVRDGRIVFISGEPPEIGNHAAAFLRQFDAVFCAGAKPRPGQRVSGEQHFNNWHFGYSRDTGYRHNHDYIRDLPPPAKTQMLSTVTSNLNYMPMHIKRRALLDRLARDYAGRFDLFGRPHRYVEYKEDAILPYRFHLCVENCAVPDLWTEKVADALLGYAVPVYAGCPNIDRYFPGATIAIDLDDYASARRTIDAILADGEAIYRERLPAVIAARQQLIARYDISALVGTLLQAPGGTIVRDIVLRPEASMPMAGLRDLAARARRKATTLVWRRRIARHG
ncbi:glycosyltransferase family 10 [uncultured Sphingomonas sp.]|uniref:glycosyltransferase family 10 domain-containing protein n=1 Tax=uncultured Sphingomonas sp. TaxID=158754 RepID=UPI0025F8A53F|nr:glycosyltransferase family 10 [uncultured Sphingomonas sp.]